MSQPLPEAEKAEWYAEQKRKAYKEAGLVFFDTNSDGEEEYVGTKAKWDKANELLEMYLNQEL